MRKYTLDADGRPVPCEDIMEWGRWMETGERVTALTEFDGGKVSTVFLGLDHSFDHGEPVLWETMIFGGPHDGYQNRYTSREAAVRGHAVAVQLATTTEVADAR